MVNAADIKRTISENIAEALRIKILKGEYKDGEHLNEVKIAEEYEVSRGPVRDAVKVLEKEGFAVTPRSGRTTAVSFTKKDFMDYHNLRRYLEKDALIKIIRNSENDDEYKAWIKMLGIFVDAMEKSISKYDDATFNLNDYKFHLAIMEKADNRIIMNVWQSFAGVRNAIREVNSQYLSYEKKANVIFGSHKDIYNALKTRDVEGVVNAIDLHMDNSINIYEAAYK